MTDKPGYLTVLTAMAEQIVDAVHTRGPGAITAAVAEARGLIVPAHALNPAELADVVSVLSQHMSPDDIALHLGAEVAHVRRWLAVPPPIAA